MTHKREFRVPVLIGSVFLFCAPIGAYAAAAPAAALNKTIRISFGVNSMVQRPGETERGFSTLVTEVIYVSGAGRLFTRHLAVGAGKKGFGGRGRKVQTGPDDGAGGRKFFFAGNSLVGQMTHVSGARLINATFDQSFTSCSVTVRDGRENGAEIRRRGPNGSLNVILSSTISSPSCSVEQGNAFGGG